MHPKTWRERTFVVALLVHIFWMFWLFKITYALIFSVRLEQRRFYIAIICARGGCERGLELYNAWEQDEKPYDASVYIRYYSPHTVVPNLAPMTTVMKPSLEFGKPPAVHWRYIFYANFIAAKHFLEQGHAMWLLRTTYDVYISWKNLWPLFSELDSKYNPREDKVFVGQVIRDMRYIHGGPGWIMSRAAVEEYVRDEARLTRIYNKRRVGDDVNIVQFVKHLNLTPVKVHTSRFVGPPLQDLAWEQLIGTNFNFSTLGKCPASAGQRQLSRVNQIALLHNGHKANLVAAYGKQLIETAPPNVYILSNYHSSSICIRSKGDARRVPRRESRRSTGLGAR